MTLIIGHQTGSITHPSNRRDIIIGMNTELGDVQKIGLPFVKNLNLTHPLTHGGILSFHFDEGRRLHMLICHSLGAGGWKDADRYVRFGLDYLWYREAEEGLNDRNFSIVEIGRGRVGQRDGADPTSIHQGMTASHLRLTLFVNHNEAEAVADRQAIVVPLSAYRAWTPEYGEQRIAA